MPAKWYCVGQVDKIICLCEWLRDNLSAPYNQGVLIRPYTVYLYKGKCNVYMSLSPPPKKKNVSMMLVNTCI